jgi:hypothetical protein
MRLLVEIEGIAYNYNINYINLQRGWDYGQIADFLCPGPWFEEGL